MIIVLLFLDCWEPGNLLELNLCFDRRCTINTSLEVPNIREAQLAMQEHGWPDVVQKHITMPVYQGDAIFKCKMPGHEVSFPQDRLFSQSVLCPKFAIAPLLK